MEYYKEEINSRLKRYGKLKSQRAQFQFELEKLETEHKLLQIHIKNLKLMKQTYPFTVQLTDFKLSLDHDLEINEDQFSESISEMPSLFFVVHNNADFHISTKILAGAECNWSGLDYHLNVESSKSSLYFEVKQQTIRSTVIIDEFSIDSSLILNSIKESKAILEIYSAKENRFEVHFTIKENSNLKEQKEKDLKQRIDKYREKN